MPELKLADLTSAHLGDVRAGQDKVTGTEKVLGATNALSTQVIDRMQAHALQELKKGNVGPAKRFNEVIKYYNKFGPVARDWPRISNVADVLDPSGGQQLAAEALNPGRVGRSLAKQHGYAMAAGDPLSSLAVLLHEVFKTEKHPEGQPWDPLTYVEKGLNKAAEFVGESKAGQFVEEKASQLYGKTVSPLINLEMPGGVKPVKFGVEMFTGKGLRPGLMDAPGLLGRAVDEHVFRGYLPGGLTPEQAKKSTEFYATARREKKEAARRILEGTSTLEKEDLSAEDFHKMISGPGLSEKELEQYDETYRENLARSELDEKMSGGRDWFQAAFQLRDDELDRLTELARVVDQVPGGHRDFTMLAYDLGLEPKDQEAYLQLATTGDLAPQDLRQARYAGKPRPEGVKPYEGHSPSEISYQPPPAAPAEEMPSTEELNLAVTQAGGTPSAFDQPMFTDEPAFQEDEEPYYGMPAFLPTASSRDQQLQALRAQPTETAARPTNRLFDFNPFPGMPRETWDPSDALAAFGEEMTEADYYQRLGQVSAGTDPTVASFMEQPPPIDYEQAWLEDHGEVPSMWSPDALMQVGAPSPETLFPGPQY